MTPEGRVKAQLKKFLDRCNCYHYWPTDFGYGKRMVDCLAFWRLQHVPDVCTVCAIECKRAGITKPTKRQALIMRELRRYGMRTFLVTLNANDHLLWFEQKD